MNAENTKKQIQKIRRCPARDTAPTH